MWRTKNDKNIKTTLRSEISVGDLLQTLCYVSTKSLTLILIGGSTMI
jgi:hypothetical protein